MIEIFEKPDCFGCAACVNACPKHCITMRADKEGFLYPVVDAEQCIECGRCHGVCPLDKKLLPADCKVQAFGAVNKTESQRQNSSSGGVFSLLAEHIMDRGGVVFGAAFTDDFKTVCHFAAETRDELKKLRGSKYLQSNVGDTYIRTKRYLEQGRPVLFTGTPCQIGGLRMFLGKDYDCLYTQSVVCHGVSSPLLWKKYAALREKEAGSVLTGVSFRKKMPDWKHYSLELTFENNREYVCRASEDAYMRCFLNELTLRSSCYQCQFKGTQDPADITLADFWGIRYILPEMDDGKGTSLILVRTEKGRHLLDVCSDGMESKEVDYAAAVQENPAAVESAKKPVKRSRFMEEIQNQPVEQVLRRYGKDTVLSKVTSRLRWYRSKVRRAWLKYRKS